MAKVASNGKREQEKTRVHGGRDRKHQWEQTSSHGNERNFEGTNQKFVRLKRPRKDRKEKKIQIKIKKEKTEG